MNSQFLGGFSSPLNIGYLLINKIAILSIVLLFFLAVHVLITLFKSGMSHSKVASTIKIALVGFLLLLLETQIKSVPFYGSLIGILQSLIVMLCLANLVAYLVVDVYFYYRMNRQVPSFLRELLTMLVYVVFALASLRVIFQIDVSSIVTTTTVLTAAVAFAMQTTIANILSGFYVQKDENLKHRTWIHIKDHDITGKIVNVGFRYTTLLTMDNRQVMVPNNYIMQNIVQTLGSREGEKTAVHLKVGLGYDMPPEKAITLLTRILQREAHVVKDPPPLVVASNFLDSSIEYDLKYFLDDYSSHMITRGSVLNKIWYAVTREGYGIPYPHREIIAKPPEKPFVAEEAPLLSDLRRTEVLQSLSEEEIRRLAARVKVKIYGNGEEVVRQGEPGDSLFIIRGGHANVYLDDALVASLAEGEIFGEMSMLTGENRKATVVAGEETHLVEISKGDIEPLIRANPAILERLSAILADREERNIEHRKKLELSQEDLDRKGTFLKKLKSFFKL